MKLYSTKITFLFAVLLIVASILFNSCKSTKHVPDGSYLLTNYAIQCDDKSINKEELEIYVKQHPNRKILQVLRFHLGIYNIANSGKERKWKTKIGSVIGEEPVMYDEFLTQKTVKQLGIYVDRKGFYNAVVKDSIHYKKKKATVFYQIKANEPYRIRNVSYQFDDDLIKPLIFLDSVNSLIKNGKILDVDMLQDERVRVTSVMKNKGYFSFTKEYVYFKIDSSFKSNQVDIVIGFKKDVRTNENNELIERQHNLYIIKNIYVYTNFDPKEALQLKDGYYSSADTTFYNQIFFLNNSFVRVRPKIISESIYISPDDLYNQTDVDRTYKSLLSLGQYKLVNIKFSEDADNTLNCIIQLSPFTMQSYTAEIEGTNASGNSGVAGNILYQHKSLLQGGEIFDLKFKGALEAQSATENEVDGVIQENLAFNTIELGAEGKIYIPKFLLPIRSIEFVKKYRPKTSLSGLYNYQKRPDYTRDLVNMTFGYSWQSANFYKHFVNPLELNFVSITENSLDFLNAIQDPFLKASYTDHMISATSYSLIYNNQSEKGKEDFFFIRLNAESAGSILTTAHNILQSTKTDGSYTIFDSKFAQYVKSDIDFRFYKFINKSSNIVYRFFGGIAYPYGNSEVMPFEKKYFAGGANSIRGWQVRTLGPGSYADNNVPIQLGDIKLEGNIEYRFKMFWLIEGAFFVDAGNIWAINTKDTREGAVFQINDFYKQFAIGTGFGTRFDFSFFVFRLDFGMKIREPEFVSGKRWLPANHTYTKNDFTINLGIGYPF